MGINKSQIADELVVQYFEANSDRKRNHIVSKIFEMYSNDLIGAFLKYGGTALMKKFGFEIDDVKQELFIHIASSFNNYKPESASVRTFLWLMVRSYVSGKGRLIEGNINAISLNAPIGENSESSAWIDIIPDESVNIEKFATSTEMRVLLNKAIKEYFDKNNVNERNRQIFYGVVMKEKMLDEVGSEIGVSRERIRQIAQKHYDGFILFFKNRYNVNDFDFAVA